jgi:hypothetical protein
LWSSYWLIFMRVNYNFVIQAIIRHEFCLLISITCMYMFWTWNCSAWLSVYNFLFWRKCKMCNRTISGWQHKQNTEINNNLMPYFGLWNKTIVSFHSYQPVQLIKKLEISFSLQKIEKIAYLRFIDILGLNLNPKIHSHWNILEHCHFSG